MLLIAHQSSRNSRPLADVARELSLTATWFESQAGLSELLKGQLRRILVLGDADISEAVVRRVCAADDKRLFGVIIAADSKALRSSNKAELVDKLVDSANLQWIPPDFSYEQLSSAARSCRRRMLRLSKEDLESAL
ncbi:MAG: hypothetical protein ACR2QT_03625, partial [Woeseiaceae bacterium]